jgi:hypothetical protein
MKVKDLKELLAKAPEEADIKIKLGTDNADFDLDEDVYIDILGMEVQYLEPSGFEPFVVLT